jgi:hypothetical protein
VAKGYFDPKAMDGAVLKSKVRETPSLEKTGRFT